MGIGLDVSIVTGKSSLLTRQKEMAVLGNNIANVNNPSYHRQTANLKNKPLIVDQTGYFGTGVVVREVTRYYDSVLESNLRTAVTDDGYFGAYAAQLDRLEDLVGPDGENFLADSIQDFADSLQDVSTTPESLAARTALIGKANIVATKFNQHYDYLVKVREFLADNTSGVGTIQSRITELNSLAGQVASYNDSIRNYEEDLFRKQDANDLRDERDELVMKMSKYADLVVTEGADSRYTITIGGHNLVSAAGVNSTSDSINMAMVAGTPTLTWASDAAAVTLSSGEIDGLIDSRAYMVNKITTINTFAQQFSNILNTQHSAGFDLDGNAGGNLFDATVPGGMTVLITDARDIAASSINTETGNGTNSRAMWTAMDTAVAALNQESLLTYAGRFNGEIAEDVLNAKAQEDAYLSIYEMFQNAVYDFSAVNMDEEMTSMLEVQKAYQASAKFVNTVNEMSNAVLNIL